MATSFVGPFLTDRALSAAPPPRPPQPIRATWMVLFSAACTCGMAAPARAETAAILPVLLINSRREVRLVGLWFIGYIFWTQTSACQFEKSAPASCGSRAREGQPAVRGARF